MTDLRDHHDIAAVLVRYATGIDRRDWDLFITVFAADCDLDYGEIGSWTTAAAVTEFMRQSHQAAGHTLHRISNISVEVDGDRAVTRSYVDALIFAPDNSSGVNAVGFYDDELVRTAAGWRIARRRFTAVRVAMVGAP